MGPSFLLSFGVGPVSYTHLLEFLTRVQSREYDESRAVLATYLYPHLKGRMTRWLEQHIGILSLSKHEMDAVRQAQRLYHSGQFLSLIHI